MQEEDVEETLDPLDVYIKIVGETTIIRAASKTCFLPRADLLTHMRVSHSNIARPDRKDYVEICEKYQLRGADGLLQRYWLNVREEDDDGDE